jgi:hypothetical protein
MSNETITKEVEKTPNDNMLKTILLMTIDRIGRILGQTNIIEELYDDIEHIDLSKE